MTRHLESGNVKNEKRTTYKVTDEEGKQHVEEVILNKDTGEVTRKLDGKEVEEPKKQEEQKKQPAVLRYSPSNADFIMIKQLEMLINQQKEISYYLRKLAADKLDDEELLKELKDGRPE